MTPSAARIDLVGIATAGVRIGPGSSTSMPTEVEAGHHRILDHMAGKTGLLLADDDAMTMVATLKYPDAGRLPDLERQLRRDQTIGTSTNPIVPKYLGSCIPAATESSQSDPAREASDAPFGASSERLVDASGLPMASKMMNNYRHSLQLPDVDLLLTRGFDYRRNAGSCRLSPCARRDDHPFEGADDDQFYAIYWFGFVCCRLPLEEGDRHVWRK